MKKSKYIFLSIMLLWLVGSCSKSERKLFPYGWTALDAEFDSVVTALERAYNSHAPQTEVDSLTALLHRAAAKTDKSEIRDARLHYWDGRRLLRQGDAAGAYKEFERAISLIDSAKYPYDVARVRWNMEEDYDCTPENYRIVQSKIAFFRDEGDLPIQADYLLTLGIMLKSMGDAEAARDYFSQADSLMKIYGDEDNIAKNKINHATVLDLEGRDPEAVELLREVLRHPSMKSDPTAVEITNWNIYLYSGDLGALRSAYCLALADSIANVEYIKLYEGMLMKEFAQRGQLDSAAYYRGKGESREIEEWSVYNYGRDYAVGLGYAALAAGNDTTAARCFRDALIMSDSIMNDDLHGQISALDTQRRIAEYTHLTEIQRIRNRTYLLCVVLGIVIVAAVLVTFLLRRLHNQRVAALHERLRREHSMRKVIGLQIAMADNDRLVEEMKEIVENISTSSVSSEELRRQLLDTLNSHTIANSTRDSFLTTFSEVNPEFYSRLGEAYPDLSEAEKRLSALISLGLDNKHIARLLNVRQESVKQARWRLRSKMNLTKEQNLDDIIRSIVNEEDK